MGVPEAYVKRVRRYTHYWTAWPPTDLVEVGDRFDVSRELPMRLGNLRDHGFDVRARSGHRVARLVLPVDTHIEASGRVEGGGQALDVSFSRTGSALFILDDCEDVIIEERAAVADAVNALRQSGEWGQFDLVVDRVTHAASGTIAISAERGGKISLRAAAGYEGLPLRGGLSVGAQNSMGFFAEVPDGLTPLFGLAQPAGQALVSALLDDVEDHDNPAANLITDGPPASLSILESMSDQVIAGVG